MVSAVIDPVNLNHSVKVNKISVQMGIANTSAPMTVIAGQASDVLVVIA